MAVDRALRQYREFRERDMTETVVGVVGLGIMGSAVSANLLDAGIAVVGYDVVAEKLDALSARGGLAEALELDLAEDDDVAAVGD